MEFGDLQLCVHHRFGRLRYIGHKMGSEPEGGENSKMKGSGNQSSKDMIFRADQIDLKSLDIQLEKHLSKVWSRKFEQDRPKEKWEIDLSKLEILYSFAHGTYGTIYKGTYGDQKVAGIFCLYSFLSMH